MLGGNRSIFTSIKVVLGTEISVTFGDSSMHCSVLDMTLRCILTHLGVLHYVCGMEEATECTDVKKKL
jgi:hypothetical protein